MTLYQILVLIHIVSAVIGMGPGFVMIFVVKKADDLSALKQAYFIRNRLHQFVMVGGSTLLLSGIGMGILNPFLFHAFWYNCSLALFLVALAYGPIVLSPKSKPIKELLKQSEGDEIPPNYYNLSKQLFFYERLEKIIFIFIIVLMVWKPYSLF
jgi:uncharacterized membrane protein